MMVPYETNAVRRSHRQRKVKWILGLCAVLFVLFCSSITWLPIAVEFTRKFFSQFIAIYYCRLYVLMLVMAIIFIVYASSGQNLAENELSDLYNELVKNSEFRRRINDGEKSPPPLDPSEETFHDKQSVCLENVASPVRDDNNIEVFTNLADNELSDLYDELVKNSEFCRRINDGEKSPPPLDPSEETFHDKQSLCLENVASPVRDDHNIEVFTITKRTVSDSPVQSNTVTEKALEGNSYRRTKREKFEKQIVESSRKELRRSETEICQGLVNSGGERARKSCSVEKLSEEEFKRRVDAFIAERKKVQWEEYCRE